MLKRNELNNFSYKSIHGKTSERQSYIFSAPQEFYLAYELSEFSDDEKEAYVAALDAIYQEAEMLVKEGVEELGLAHNYRKFLAEGVSE